MAVGAPTSGGAAVLTGGGAGAGAASSTRSSGAARAANRSRTASRSTRPPSRSPTPSPAAATLTSGCPWRAYRRVSTASGNRGRSLREPQAQVVGRERPAPQIALAELAAEIAQVAGQLGILDPFGDDGEPERMGERDHAGDDGGVALAGGQTAHEAAVDLELVDGQLPEVHERGVTGAE